VTIAHTLSELVNLNSVSARSNVEIVSYLQKRCEEVGFSTSHFPYTDEHGVEKVNLVALAGTDRTTDGAAELALVGHTDTVPFDPGWGDALKLTRRDGNLYGRGACDTKGFLAAALTAAHSVDLRSLRRPLALVFTADEEAGCIGAKHLAAGQVLRVRYAIVGEPTSLTPMRAGKGYCLADLTVHGKEAHSAYPALGASAIYRAARLLAQLERIGNELTANVHAEFDPPFTTLNVGLISGGTAKNVVPAQCRLTLEWRPIPGQGSQYLLDLLTKAITSEMQSDPDFECTVSALRADDGFETSVDSPLVRFLAESSGHEPGTIAFGTEAPQLIELGAQPVVFGPGNIRVAHRTDEFVGAEQLDRCATILGQAIRRFCCQTR
jgi:acetylornithine deacetylase